jgi:hypothetical protein
MKETDGLGKSGPLGHIKRMSEPTSEPGPKRPEPAKPTQDAPTQPPSAPPTPGPPTTAPTGEIGGPKGPEPTRYGDWEVGGRCTDF